MQARLLSAAILATLAVSAPVFAAQADSPAALRAKGMIDGRAAAAVQRADADSFTVKNAAVTRAWNAVQVN